MLYSSRSATETYQECRRKRYLNYHYGGRGIVGTRNNVPYTTGICVHAGIEYLLRLHKSGQITASQPISAWLDSAVDIALAAYSSQVQLAGIEVTEGSSEFVYRQELAKTEALVRAWAIAEYPLLVKYYDIFAVENELAIPLEDNIIYQARVDAILRDKEDGSFYNYSLKTLATYQGDKTDKSFAIALQTLTEQWAAEAYLTQISKILGEFNTFASLSLAPDKYASLSSFLSKHLPTPALRIKATKHCFLLKGPKSKYSDDEEDQIGTSPLTRGYRFTSDGEHYSYAHSFKFPESSNRSGYGRLGKGWEPFNAWETEGGIKAWIELLASRVKDHSSDRLLPEIQPECGDIIKAQVVTPPDTFRNTEALAGAMAQVTSIEQEVSHALALAGVEDTFSSDLDEFFPMNRQSCYWPSACDYLPICHLKDWKNERVDKLIRIEPVKSGHYNWRMPHHDLEAKALGGRNGS